MISMVFRKIKKRISCVSVLVMLVLCVGCVHKEETPENNIYTDGGYDSADINDDHPEENTVNSYVQDALSQVKDFSGEPYCVINDNRPYFSYEDAAADAFELYSELDSLGRCGVAYANICAELMPTEERGEIGNIRPSGWQTVKYPELIEDRYLYNRCHLIGYQLAGENDNEKNLITGTRYLNVSGMLDFENKVYDYVVNTDRHVLYRVTPVFVGDNLVASGVIMEAFSVEDIGKGICFCVYVYNVQPGIIIDYSNGDSQADDSYVNNQTSASGISADTPENTPGNIPENTPDTTYILNNNTYKMHYPDCKSVEDMAEKNKIYFAGTREEAIEAGFEPCKSCKP